MKPRLAAIPAPVLALAVATLAFAGDDTTSLSYISYLERYATLRAAHAQETLDAVVNMPVMAGDRLQTARGARVEVRLADGCTLWLDEFTALDFDAVARARDEAAPRTSLYLAEGGAALELPNAAASEDSLRLDTPNGTFFLSGPGFYRIDIEHGDTHVRAFAGLAELPSGTGSALLRGGEEAEVVAGGDIQKAALTQSDDDFWSWVQERRRPAPTGPTAQHVEAQDASQSAVLDSYGDWVYVPTFSNWMWRPNVPAMWQPYSYGRWYWTPVGWNWISYEPWGWYPYHYGSWFLDASFGWVWGYDPVWAPAWVHWLYTPGYVGWCPRGYYDWWYAHNYEHNWKGGRPPRHWGEVAFDFSGHVPLRQVDPRPWTIVPSGQFGSRHIDRVRVEGDRFFREQPAGREGYIRSGALLTLLPGRQIGDGVLAPAFMRAGGRELPGLASVLGRQFDHEQHRAVSAPLPALGTAQLAAAAARMPAFSVAGAGTRGESVTGRRVWSGNAPGNVGQTESGRLLDRRFSGAPGQGTAAPVERRGRVEDAHRERVFLADPAAAHSGTSGGPSVQPHPHVESHPAPPVPAPPPPRGSDHQQAQPRNSVSRFDTRVWGSRSSRGEPAATTTASAWQRGFDGNRRSSLFSSTARQAAAATVPRVAARGWQGRTAAAPHGSATRRRR